MAFTKLPHSHSLFQKLPANAAQSGGILPNCWWPC